MISSRMRRGTDEHAGEDVIGRKQDWGKGKQGWRPQLMSDLVSFSLSTQFLSTRGGLIFTALGIRCVGSRVLDGWELGDLLYQGI